jgi:hypothetical protein
MGTRIPDPEPEPVAVDPVAQTIEQEDVPVARAAALIEESLNAVTQPEAEPEVEEEPVEPVADKALL